MNNKGFGLQEVLVFIGIFMFVLVAVSIYGKAKLSNSDDKSIETNISDETDYIDSLDELTPVDINKTDNQYIDLENKLVEASKHYLFDKSENMVISLKDLQDEYLLGDLVDTNNNICDGYVMYNSNNDTYLPYINCNGMYKTKNFDNNLLKK